MDLPAEIRCRIWTIYYQEVSRPRMRYTAEIGGIVDVYTEANLDLFLANKQICAQTMPILLANIELNIVYTSSAPMQLAHLPSESICNSVRTMRFHCHWTSICAYQRPPKKPVKFKKFPRLAEFRVCKNTRIDLAVPWQGAGRPVLDPSAYRALPKEERMAAWEGPRAVSADFFIENLANFGRGGWMSRLVDQERRDEPLELDADPDSEHDDPDWQVWSEDLSASYQGERLTWDQIEEKTAKD